MLFWKSLQQGTRHTRGALGPSKGGPAWRRPPLGPAGGTFLLAGQTHHIPPTPPLSPAPILFKTLGGRKDATASVPGLATTPISGRRPLFRRSGEGSPVSQYGVMAPGIHPEHTA